MTTLRHTRGSSRSCESGNDISDAQFWPLGESSIVDVSDCWDRHVGLLWADVLRESEIRLDGRVIELGPGFSAKIGHALAEVGFHGEVVLIEPNYDARRTVADKYVRLLPQASVRTRPLLLRRPVQPLLGRVDVLLGNHILDDLFLSIHLPFRDSDPLFAEMRTGRKCSDYFVQTWRRILDNQIAVEYVISEVVDLVVRHLTATRPDYLVINQYPSWQQSASGLDAIHEIGLTVLRRLTQRLESDLSLSVCLRRLANCNMYWLISERRPESRRV